MTITQILADFPMLSETDIHNAFDSAKRKISLQPMLVSCVASNVYNKGLVGPDNCIEIDGDVYTIKEVKEVISETPIYELEDLVVGTDPEDIRFSFEPLTPSGEAYYNNNSLTCLTATLNLICYIYPHIASDGQIPDGFSLITIAKALSNHCAKNRDIAGITQYDAIYHGLINHLNLTLNKVMPQSWCNIGELVAHAV